MDKIKNKFRAFFLKRQQKHIDKLNQQLEVESNKRLPLFIRDFVIGWVANLFAFGLIIAMLIMGFM